MSTNMQHQVSCNATTPFVTFLATLNDKTAQRKVLGSWIKTHREAINISQETAAEEAGLSRFQWIRLENGQSGTKRETLIVVAKVIKADVNQTLARGGFSELFSSENKTINSDTEKVPYKRTLDALARSGTLSDRDDVFLAGIIDQIEKRNREEN